MSLAPTNAIIPLRLNARVAVDKTSTLQESDSTSRLTRGLAGADDGAFREFHTRYFDRLYRFLLVVARGQEDEAREALQQTLVRVARYARVFNSEEAFWAWLKAVARSAARDAGRKRSRYEQLLRAFAWRRECEADPAPDGSAYLESLLEENLARLSIFDRRMLEAKYIEGFSVKDLAADAGLSEKAVESRLTRLRQQVRESLLRELHSS